MKHTFQIIANILGEPRAAFQALREQPNFFMVWVIIAFASIGIAWAVLPFSEHIGQAIMLEQGLDKAEIEETREAAAVLSIAGIFFAPLPLLIKWLFFAVFLWFGAQLLGSTEALKFKPMLAVVVHTELILVLSHLINAALLLCFKDISDIQDSIDLQMIPGLHLLFGDHALGSMPLTFLSQITPFSIWYLVVLSLGVAIVGNLNRKRAELLAVLVWLADFGFRTAIAIYSKTYISSQ